MPNHAWSDRLARSFAVLRGAMLVVFCVFLIVEPERALPGSSSEPARSVALMFASRTILLGVALLVLAIRRKPKGLAWVLLADAAFQLFDIGMALVMHKGALAVLPAVLGALDVWAATVQVRAAREAQPAVGARD